MDEAASAEASGANIFVHEAVGVDARLGRDAACLTQRQMSDLCERDPPVVNRHIRNVFANGELNPESSLTNFLRIQFEGGQPVTREVNHYNPDALIWVGYEVKSWRGQIHALEAEGVAQRASNRDDANA